MTNTASVLERLNDYTGDNIWQDVIYDLLTAEEWEAAPADAASSQFQHGGVNYRYEPSYGEWIAWAA